MANIDKLLNEYVQGKHEDEFTFKDWVGIHLGLFHSKVGLYRQMRSFQPGLIGKCARLLYKVSFKIRQFLDKYKI